MRTDGWNPPTWLLPHQVDAARRTAASLEVFGGALLADAVGLGKTFVALAVATRYHRLTAVVPAALHVQWRQAADRLGIDLTVVSHEALSHGAAVPDADLVVVDEAHRFRNPTTQRYDRLARGLRTAHLLLVTATPVVNRPDDLVHLLRLFLPDHGLALLGLPSLALALAKRDLAAIAHASTPLIVARSHTVLDRLRTPFPRPLDGPVRCSPPLPAPLLTDLLATLDTLEFPAFRGEQAAHLLRAHILHRLASSAAACRDSLRRHLAYLDRAFVTGADGPLARGSARKLFGSGDALQLELAALEAIPLHQRTVERERARILAALERLPMRSHPNPKARQLAQILAGRADGQTIVFTTAAATAYDLASRLGWREVAVVAAGHAQIASGRISVDGALNLFAPHARATPNSSPTQRVVTLIATDLVSEGLDLQDADAIVHYDLPWTPLRLAQRLGRIARLGSTHAVALVHWFVPPPPLERRLQLCVRLACKQRSQLSLAVPTTSAVGKAQVLNSVLEYRERLIARTLDGESRSMPRPPEPPRTLRSGIPFAVVPEIDVVALAIRWDVGSLPVREIVVIRDSTGDDVGDFGYLHSMVKRLLTVQHSAHPWSIERLTPLCGILRERLRCAQRGAVDRDTLSLRRRLLRHARLVARQRDAALIETLDRVLNRVTAGIGVGATRELTDLLTIRPLRPGLHRWLLQQPDRTRVIPDFHIEAIVLTEQPS